MPQTEPAPCPLQPQHERNYSFLQKDYYPLLMQKPTSVITSLRINCKACTTNTFKKMVRDVFPYVFFSFACVRQQNSPLDELLRRGRVGGSSSSRSMSPISRHHHWSRRSIQPLPATTRTNQELHQFPAP
jgi:hypothetical protein